MATTATKSLQTLSDDYQTVQSDLQTAISARQKLQAQESENVSVEKEFDNSTTSDHAIYKLVGPVLLKQDRSEAVQAVKGRLEFIRNEIKRAETNIQDLQQKAEKVKMEIYHIQSQQQQEQQALGEAQTAAA